MKRWLISMALALTSLSAWASDTVTTPRVKARIVSDVAAVAPGASFSVGLDFELKKGWHTYWKNPGDSGEPMKVTWKVSSGVAAGPLVYPPPKRIDLPPLANFGYEDRVLIYSDMTAASEAVPGSSLQIQADATWLVCEETCIPEKGSFAMTLPVASETSASAAAATFSVAREKQPKPFPAARFVLSDRGIDLIIPDGMDLPTDTTQLFFFPETPGIIQNAATQVAAKDGVKRSLRLVAAPALKELPKNLSGILVTGDKSYALGESPVHAVVVELPPSAEISAPAAPAVAPILMPAVSGFTATRAIPFAFLGGLLLNLMPCVFPVLSVKVLGFLKKSGHDHGKVRMHGWAYAFGVLLSFGGLAALLLFLRWSGEALGWGFQLQSPLFVLGMIFLMFLMGLSLLGLFEVGGSLMGAGSKLAGRSGVSGSFFTGVLATVVATPCTAPFMGPAVGFALGQPAVMALSVFFALGAGMALPYLVLSHAPGLLKLLPKPGVWMETFQQAMAFPLFATVIWLLWVAGRQVPESLSTILLGLLGLGFAAWLGHRVKGLRPIALLVAVGAIAWTGMDVRHEMKNPPAAATADPGWKDFSEAELATLRAEGRAVFIDFTAAWCLTCQVNKKTVLEREDVRRAFDAKGVTLIRADWTNQDAAISRALEGFGRQGVPLYVYYPSQGAVKILPALLTKSIVLEALGIETDSEAL